MIKLHESPNNKVDWSLFRMFLTLTKIIWFRISMNGNKRVAYDNDCEFITPDLTGKTRIPAMAPYIFHHRHVRHTVNYSPITCFDYDKVSRKSSIL